jgi:hypothetical protein
MEDITFKILKDNELTLVSSSEIFLNKRILLCSIATPQEKLPALYLKHLEECQKKYKKYGIDDVYIINTSHSFDNKWLLAYVDSFFPKLIPIVDYEAKFNNYLKETLSLYKEHNQYQLLINNGEIESFYTTEEEDFVGYTEYLKVLKYIEKNIEKISKIEIKKYKSKKQNILTLGANMLISSLKNKNKTHNHLDLQIIIARAFFYNRLWPNTKLEEYLQIKK